MTLTELHQATQGFRDGDWLLVLMGSSGFWAVVCCVLIMGICSRTRPLPSEAHYVCVVLSAVYAVLMLMILLPVPPQWVRSHGTVAHKGAVHLNWAKTDPAAFSRFDAMRLLAELEDEEHAADVLVAKIVKAGGDTHAAEAAVMTSLSEVHKAKGLR